MNFGQIHAYAGFWGGVIAIISLLNTLVSHYLYKTRQIKVSAILRIIFYFSNFVCYTAVIGLYLAPEHPTMLYCTSLQYLVQIGDSSVRVLLSAYLLLRLVLIHNNRMDNTVCLVLLLLKVDFGTPLVFQQPTTAALHKLSVCSSSYQFTENPLFSIFMITIVIDILIDFYVAIRLYQILRKANKEAASNMENKNKRTIFTAIMYWSFLLLLVSLIFQILPLLILVSNNEWIIITLQSLVNIILSYIIITDFGIVRITEDGEGTSTDDSKESPKSVSLRTPLLQNYSGHSPNDLLKYSLQDSSFNDDKISV